MAVPLDPASIYIAEEPSVDSMQGQPGSLLQELWLLNQTALGLSHSNCDTPEGWSTNSGRKVPGLAFVPTLPETWLA